MQKVNDTLFLSKHFKEKMNIATKKALLTSRIVKYET